jgi:protein TonB
LRFLSFFLLSDGGLECVVRMRLSAFLFISVALHAAALAYPVVFPDLRDEKTIAVVLLSAGAANGEKTRGDGRAEGKAGKPAGPKPPTPTQAAEREDRAEETSLIHSHEASLIALDTPVAPDGVAVASVATNIIGTVGGGSTQSANGISGIGGKGRSGRGDGAGFGRGEGGGEAKFVQARYAYNPKPDYPDRARRDGKEGRVLLRVLVNEDGRSASVEVSRSSGIEALDQAAVEAIKRWRFSSARLGDRPVESWVRIPIDFRLTDVRD